jgi:hypothetical protein
MSDATWIADLPARGLFGSSFRLRDYAWTRRELVGEVARHAVRPQETLEIANPRVALVEGHRAGNVLDMTKVHDLAVPLPNTVPPTARDDRSVPARP